MRSIAGWKLAARGVGCRRSGPAIERHGAKLDGILRAHMTIPNGTLRDTCVYSILATEWPAVKANLEWKLSQPRD
jgi:hypothetical protein